MKSWNSGALDRDATRGSVAYTLVLHHLSSFIFNSYSGDTLSLRNKLVKSLLRDCSHKQHHEVLIFYICQTLVWFWLNERVKQIECIRIHSQMCWLHIFGIDRSGIIDVNDREWSCSVLQSLQYCYCNIGTSSSFRPLNSLNYCPWLPHHLSFLNYIDKY